MKLKQLANGEYIGEAPQIRNELFDLVVSTVNLLESCDVSTTRILGILESSETSRHEMLESVIAELEDLLNSGQADYQFEGLHCCMIETRPIES